MNHSDRNNSGHRRISSLPEAVLLLILVAILLAYAPAIYKTSREKAFDAHCVTNLRELSTALFAYAQDHDGTYPITEGTAPGDFRQTNWILELASDFAEPIQSYEASDGRTQWFCPAARDQRDLLSGQANTYGINWQASGGWMSSEGTAPGPGAVERPDLMGQIMDGSWNGTSYPTYVNSPGGIQVPDFVHAASAGNDARIHVAYIDGRVGPLKREDLPADPADPFWTGQE